MPCDKFTNLHPKKVLPIIGILPDLPGLNNYK